MSVTGLDVFDRTIQTRRIADGEIEDVKHALPAPIRELWPSDADSSVGRAA